MYVCTYVRMYVCTYVRMYVCTYVRMYVCTYARMYVCTYVRMYVCTYVGSVATGPHHGPDWVLNIIFRQLQAWPVISCCAKSAKGGFKR